MVRNKSNKEEELTPVMLGEAGDHTEIGDTEAPGGVEDRSSRHQDDDDVGTGGDGLFTQYMEKVTPRGSPDSVKQLMAMILSALLGAILMILILGGRKTYNITEQVVAPPSSSTDATVVQEGNITTLVSEEYQLQFNSGSSSYQLTDKEFEQACIKLDEITDKFVDGMIKDFYMGCEAATVGVTQTVGVGLCSQNSYQMTSRFQTTVVFAADSMEIPSTFEISILLMDFFTDPYSRAAYKSLIREELSQTNFFKYAAPAGDTGSPSFQLYNLVN